MFDTCREAEGLFATAKHENKNNLAVIHRNPKNMIKLKYIVVQYLDLGPPLSADVIIKLISNTVACAQQSLACGPLQCSIFDKIFDFAICRAVLQSKSR